MREPLVVFDCVVFLQGLIKESGPAVTCIERFEQGRVSLVISPEILAELREVLTRSQLRRDFSSSYGRKGRQVNRATAFEGQTFA